ncbi:MAG TPA: hypothetical protein VLQ45_31295 [Thermoanaerobaculia bacterium]|nr:hypothetical protein [Thermoanaerobaculia bacterium]
MSSAADRERRSRNVLCLSVLGLLVLVHVLPDHLRLVVTPSIPRGAYWRSLPASRPGPATSSPSASPRISPSGF